MGHQVAQAPDAGLAALLQQHGLTQVGDILALNLVDLCESLGLSYSRGQRLRDCVCKQIAPAPLSAAQLLQSATAPDRIAVRTGLLDLDRALRGRLPVGAITELVGPAGAGKSQVCMSVVVNVAASHPHGIQRSVIYIDTEGKFNVVRLSEMARSRFAAAATEGGGPTSAAVEQLVLSMLGRVSVVHAPEPEQLLHALHNMPVLAQEQGTGLLILDSVAALARGAMGAAGNTTSAMRARGELLGQAASQLKSCAEQLHIPVLVTNQVTARPAGAGATSHQFQQAAAGGAGDSGEGYLSAALGTAWAHSVNVRCILERVGEQRRLQLVKSPASANMALEYLIEAAGVRQVVSEGQLVPSIQGNVLHAPIQNQIDYRLPEDADDQQ